MADDNRFFRWLGRINSLLFFLGVVGLLLFVGGSALMWRTVSREEPVAAITKSGGETYAFGGSIGAPTPSLGGPEITRLEGTDEGVMVLQRGGPRASGLDRVSGYDANDVNYLLVDLRTMKTRWLFDGVKRDIGYAFQVRETVPAPQNSPDPVTALLMPVAEADTNGDGKINGTDHHALYLYRVDSAGPVRLLDSHSISGIEQLDGERVVVSYYDGESDHAALLSAKDFHMIADTRLSTLPSR